MKNFTWLFAGLLLSPILAGAMSPLADPVGGPSVGFSPNADGSILWPIIGIPGASQLGRPLAIGPEILGAVVSPRQDYLLGIRAEDGQPVISRLTSEPRGSYAIDGAQRNTSIISISPTGSTVALFNPETKILQVFSGMPDAPALAFESDTASASGRATAIAVSDDASLALMGFSVDGSDSLWVMSPLNSRFVSSGRASSLAFIANRHDAVVADNVSGEAFLLQQAYESPTRIALISPGQGVAGLAGIAVSDDGRFVVVAGAASGTIGIIDMEQSTRTVVSCKCRPSGVYRMSGTAVFRLNEPPDGLLTLLDLSSGKPRVLVVPPAPKLPR